MTRRCTVLAEPRSKAPPYDATRPRCFLPRAEPVASVSDALCRGCLRAGSDLAIEPARRHRQAPRPRSPRQKRPLRRNQDAFPRRVPSPPLRPAPLAHARSAFHRARSLRCAPGFPGGGLRLPPPTREGRGRGISESPPPYARLGRRAPASNVPSPPEHEGRLARPDRFRDRTRRLSSTSATRTIHEHNHVTARSLARSGRRVSPARAGLGQAPDGACAPSTTPTAALR